MPVCRACRVDAPRSAFSSHQLKHGSTRRCHECVASLTDPAVRSSGVAKQVSRAEAGADAGQLTHDAAAESDEFAERVQSLSVQLQQRGVAIIEGVYSEEQVAAFQKNHDQLFSQVKRHMSKSPGDTRQYINTFKGKQTSRWTQVWDIDGEEEVYKLAEGRYDFTYGMASGCFGKSAFHEPPIVAALMKHLLKSDYTHYAAALPSQVKSDFGPWHRDTYDLFGDDRIDVSLPPFYYTILIPLVEMTTENGATELILGSHRRPADTCDVGDHFHACCKPGSVVVFDGRCCHRGMPNTTEDERIVLYMVWHKTWYNDYGSLEFNFPFGSWRDG